MSQNRVGLVAVANSSNSVVGTNTKFLLSDPGDLFTLEASGVPYYIGAIANDTHLTLTALYAGITAAAQEYVIHDDFSPIAGFPLPAQGDIETPTIIRRALLMVEAALSGVGLAITIADGAVTSPGLRVGTELSTGLYKSGAGAFGVAVLGVASALFTVTGVNATPIGVTTPAAVHATTLSTTGDTVIGGSLTVNGPLVSVNSTNIAVADSLVKFGAGNILDITDEGFYGVYQPSATPLYAGLFRDATDGKFKLFDGLQVEPTSTVNVAGTGYAAAAFQVGALTATTGAFSGAVGMTALTATTGAFSGAVGMTALTATTGAFSGAVGMTALTATTGAFSGAVGMTALTATTGAFSGAVGMTALTATTGAFSGAVGMAALTATTGAFSGAVGMTALTATTGAFSGAVGMTALTATGASITGGAASSNQLNFGLATGAATESRIILRAGASNYAWQIANYYNVADTLEFTPSTAVGGSAFSTPTLKLAPGAAVVGGTITASGTITSSATLSFSGGFAGDNDYTVGAVRMRMNNNTDSIKFYTNALLGMTISGASSGVLNTTLAGSLTVAGAVTTGATTHTGAGSAISLLVSNSSSVGMVYSGGANQSATAGENAANAMLYVRKDTTTSRSINAAGTINAAGADLAEYRRKRDDCGLVIAGQVVGYDVNGEITDCFSLLVRGAIKSTNPHVVGGDMWGGEDQIGARPAAPTQGDDEDEAAFGSRVATYDSERAAFDARLEAQRQMYDRIAYSGEVPMFIGAAGEKKAGDFVVPRVGDEDAIEVEFIDKDVISLSAYVRRVGTVTKVNDDGTCIVSVING